MNSHESNSDRPPEDTLEARLARQPLRPIPETWKAGILAAARTAAEATPARTRESQNYLRHRIPAAEPTWLERFLARFPVATAGLATAWLFVWVASSTDRWLNGAVAQAAPPVSAEQIAEARAQRAALWQLAGFEDRLRPDPPNTATEPTRSPVLRPRSDRRLRADDFFGLTSDRPERSIA